MNIHYILRNSRLPKMEYGIFFISNCKFFHRFSTKYSLNNNILNFEKILCAGSSCRRHSLHGFQVRIQLNQWNKVILAQNFYWLFAWDGNELSGIFMAFLLNHQLRMTETDARFWVGKPNLAPNLAYKFDHEFCCTGICTSKHTQNLLFA